MNKKVSLKDVAKQAGVSTTLVSYVLNNQKENRINKTVAQRIKDIAKELNYRGNLIARSLKTNRTHTIGLVVADIANPFSAAMARIVEDEANRHNYTVIFGSSDESADKCSKTIDALLDRQVDGLLIAPPEGMEAQLQRLQQNKFPFVLIDRYLPELEASHVTVNNFKSAYNAVNHLAVNGYHRIGFITYNMHLFNMEERSRGYRQALEDSGLAFTRNLVKELDYHKHPSCLVEKAIHDLLSLPQPADALFFSNNMLAMHGLKYINRQGIEVPEQLGIVSFDESEAFDLFHTSITCIKQPLAEMAQVATRMLLESIDNNNKIMKVNLETELIVAQSSRPFNQAAGVA